MFLKSSYKSRFQSLLKSNTSQGWHETSKPTGVSTNLKRRRHTNESGYWSSNASCVPTFLSFPPFLFDQNKNLRWLMYAATSCFLYTPFSRKNFCLVSIGRSQRRRWMFHAARMKPDAWSLVEFTKSSKIVDRAGEPENRRIIRTLSSMFRAQVDAGRAAPLKTPHRLVLLFHKITLFFMVVLLKLWDTSE